MIVILRCWALAVALLRFLNDFCCKTGIQASLEMKMESD
jgi:hypothetical protein